MKKLPFIIGQRFGRLITVTETRHQSGRLAYLCRCDCGNVKIVLRGNLGRNTLSCGCLNQENRSAEHWWKRKHGHCSGDFAKSGTRTYKTWISMRERCLSPRNERWGCYGGKGITICERWNDFENFLEDMGERPPNMTLDRINVMDGYYKENCRWASYKDQARNRTNTRYLDFQGDRKCLSEWGEIFGLKPQTISYRLRRGWSIEEAFSGL